MTRKELLEYKLEVSKKYLNERKMYLQFAYGQQKDLIQECIERVEEEIQDLKTELKKIN